MARNETPTAGAVIVGNELLSGKIRDENTPFLSANLRRLGVALRRVVVVPDEREDIVEAVRQAHGAYDYVFTSGGVGPTHDDITIPCVAEALGRPVVRDQGLEHTLRGLFGEHLKPAHLRMADVPQGATLVESRDLMVPTIRVENVFILPGVPEIFREKVIALRPVLAAAPWHARYLYLTLGEGTLAPILDGVVEGHPEVEVGSYPRLAQEGWRVRVTVESKTLSRVVAATEDLLARLPGRCVLEVEDPGAEGAARDRA